MQFKMLKIADILREYEQARLTNKRKLQERRAEVYEQIPEIRDLEQTSRSDYLALAIARIEGRAADDATQDTNRSRTEQKRSLLAAHGYPEDYLDPIYDCADCEDTGFINGARCHCFMKRLTDRLYLMSNLRDILEHENFSTFDLDYYSREPWEDKTYTPYDNAKSILEKSHQFVDAFNTPGAKRGNLLFYGDTGLGKTFLTNCIAKELLDSGHTVLYLTANELFESVLAEYHMKDNKALADVYNYVYSCELLIIDDLGTELTNSYVVSQLFEIINRRGNYGLSCLISTNLSMQKFASRYNERIMSRIVANYTIFNLYGDNIRYQKRKKIIQATT